MKNLRAIGRIAKTAILLNLMNGPTSHWKNSKNSYSSEFNEWAYEPLEE